MKCITSMMDYLTLPCLSFSCFPEFADEKVNSYPTHKVLSLINQPLEYRRHCRRYHHIWTNKKESQENI